MLRWPDRFRGVVLREGMLFNVVAFEDQGTGGAAFRLLYGEFLREAAERFGSTELRDLARRMIAHGRDWRAASRKLILLARQIPTLDERYDDWYAANGAAFRDGLAELSRTWMGFADTELAFFQDLRRAAARLESAR